MTRAHLYRVEIRCTCCEKRWNILASQHFFDGYSYCDNCNRVSDPAIMPCDHKPWRRRLNAAERAHA